MNARTDEIEAEIDATRARVGADIDELRERLSPGQLVDRAMSYLQHDGGDFVGNLGRTVRDHPVPVLMLGIGTAWLMMSGATGGRRGRGDEAAREGHDGVEDYETFQEYAAGHPPAGEPDRRSGGTHAYATEEGEPYPGSAEASGLGPYQTTEGYPYGSAASEGTAGTEDEPGRAARVAAAAEERAGRFGHGVGESGRAARERAAGMAGAARHRAGRTAEEARRGVGGAARRTGYGARRAGQGMAGFFEEQPVAMAALGLAAGALLGAVVPETRREHRTLGPMRERLRAEAVSAAEEQRDKAVRVAEAGREAGQEEAEAQGLTPGAGAERLKEAEAGAVKVAKAAEEGAEAERDRQKLGR